MHLKNITIEDLEAAAANGAKERYDLNTRLGFVGHRETHSSKADPAFIAAVELIVKKTMTHWDDEAKDDFARDLETMVSVRTADSDDRATPCRTPAIFR